MTSHITSSVATFQSFSLEVWGPLDNATRYSWQNRLTLGPYNVANKIQRSPVRLPVPQHDYLDHMTDFSAVDDSRPWTNRVIPSVAPIQDVLPELWDPVDAVGQNTWPERVDFACRPHNPWNEIAHIPASSLQQRHRSGFLASFSSIQSAFPDLWDQVDNCPRDPWPNRNVALAVQKRGQPEPIARPLHGYEDEDEDDDEATETASEWGSDTESEWESDFESDWDVDSGFDSCSDASSVASGHSGASR